MIFDHTGWLVADLAAAREALEPLGPFEYTEPCLDERQGVSIVFVRGPGGLCLELVQPVGDASVVSKLLTQRGAGPYHACWQSTALTDDVARLESAGYRLVSEPASAPAFGERLFCFLFHRQLGLVELVEAPTTAR